jgi:hypothetical protein
MLTVALILYGVGCAMMGFGFAGLILPRLGGAQ